MLRSIIKNSFFLAAASAVLLRLSFPKFDLWILAWFAFVPLFFALRKHGGLKVFAISFFSGFLFFVLTVFWLIHVTVPGMFILSFYLGLYWAAFGLIYGSLKTRLNFWQRIFFAPCLWVSLEFARSHFLTGFPWALLAYSQTFNLAAIQAADIFGAYGVSFIVVFVNIALFEIIRDYPTKAPFKVPRLLIPLLILLAWLAYGSYRINEDPQRSCPFKIAIVQGNIPQEIKWVSSFQDRIFKKYQLLTDIIRLKNNPDLIIWPETAFPDYLEFGDNDAPLKDLAKETETPLLVGSIRFKDMRYYNSAILFSPKGAVLGVYDKIHLVPFGEYIPSRKILRFVERVLPIEDFTPGTEHEIFSVGGLRCPGIKLGVLICFEDIFGDLASRLVRRGADFLVNITNDAWFGDTSSPYQHMEASVFRAVENRVFVVRAANTGISCVLDDLGRSLVTVKGIGGKETFVTGAETSLIYKTGRRGLYTKTGDIFTFACMVYAFIMLMSTAFRRGVKKG